MSTVTALVLHIAACSNSISQLRIRAYVNTQFRAGKSFFPDRIYWPVRAIPAQPHKVTQRLATEQSDAMALSLDLVVDHLIFRYGTWGVIDVPLQEQALFTAITKDPLRSSTGGTKRIGEPHTASNGSLQMFHWLI